MSDTIEEMTTEGIEETADTAEAPEENVSDSGTAGETEDSVPADDASVTTDEETQTAEESPADNETLEEAKEKETHSVEVIINGTPVTDVYKRQEWYDDKDTDRGSVETAV